MKIQWQKIKNFFLHFFTLDDTPHNIAGGLALGVFLGTLPGVGLVAMLLVVSLFKLNKSAAIIGVLATNVWGTIVALPMATFIGGFLFGQNPAELSIEFERTYQLGLKFFLTKAIFFDLALPLISGFIISAGAIAMVFYFIVYFLLKYKKVSA